MAPIACLAKSSCPNRSKVFSFEAKVFLLEATVFSPEANPSFKSVSTSSIDQKSSRPKQKSSCPKQKSSCPKHKVFSSEAKVFLPEAYLLSLCRPAASIEVFWLGLSAAKASKIPKWTCEWQISSSNIATSELEGRRLSTHSNSNYSHELYPPNHGAYA
jgi:hypothetical protein